MAAWQLSFVVQCSSQVGEVICLLMCREAALYYTTVLYRLRAEYNFLKIVLLTGTIVHGVTHFIQAVLLTAFFVGERCARTHARICMSLCAGW